MIVVLDCETTGKDRGSDRIIELCFQFGLDELARFQSWRFSPGVPIHPEAQRVHGISAEALVGCPTFAEVAEQVETLLRSATAIVGYNVRFDLDMLQAELDRAGRAPLDLTRVLLVDPLRLWQTIEPRTLEAAFARFVGEPFEDAHSARADVAATAQVLTGMLHAFGLDASDWTAIAAKADPLPERHAWLGPSNHIQWRDGEIVFGFGKYAWMRVRDVDPGYVRWLLDKGFPEHVKEIAAAALRERPEQFRAWASSRWPEPKHVEPLAEAG